VRVIDDTLTGYMLYLTFLSLSGIQGLMENALRVSHGFFKFGAVPCSVCDIRQVDKTEGSVLPFSLVHLPDVAAQLSVALVYDIACAIFW